MLECTKKVYAYALVQPLQLKGRCILSVGVSQIHQSLSAEFYITCGKVATLLGRKTSEMLGVLIIMIVMIIIIDTYIARYPLIAQSAVQ